MIVNGKVKGKSREGLSADYADYTEAEIQFG
jgi:hypothetical protein